MGEKVMSMTRLLQSRPWGFVLPEAVQREIEIVRRLESSDGVVVQGRPERKTHTISNIICHYLAQADGARGFAW